MNIFILFICTNIVPFLVDVGMVLILLSFLYLVSQIFGDISRGYTCKYQEKILVGTSTFILISVPSYESPNSE
jgi:hypothetical protein